MELELRYENEKEETKSLRAKLLEIEGRNRE